MESAIGAYSQRHVEQESNSFLVVLVFIFKKNGGGGVMCITVMIFGKNGRSIVTGVTW
jgi:hypothetical protein